MVEHNLSCPPYGYLGQDYGLDLKQLLQTPMRGGLANDIIEKMRVDVPLLAAVPGQVNLFTYDADIDRKVLVVEVGGQLLSVSTGLSA